ncbi:PilZ domain-containing protein [Vibrio sp. PP-XX7]
MMEKRRFSRIIYRGPAPCHSRGCSAISATIRDLSLHGVLLAVMNEPRFNPEQPIEIEFPIPDSDISIQMTANIVLMNEHTLRANIDHIDLDSICHLRRLVELNVGSDALLHRELEHLSDLGDTAE